MFVITDPIGDVCKYLGGLHQLARESLGYERGQPRVRIAHFCLVEALGQRNIVLAVHDHDEAARRPFPLLYGLDI